jgi:hypothetical protein
MASAAVPEVSLPQIQLASGGGYRESGSPLSSPRASTSSKAELVLRDLIDKELIYFKCLQAVKYVRLSPFEF